MTLPFEARLQVLAGKAGRPLAEGAASRPTRGMGAAGRCCLEHEWGRGSRTAHDDFADGEVQPSLSAACRIPGVAAQAFGYDCSGFVQMLMRQRGYLIPRDADVQAAWSGFVPVKVSRLRAGDVLFFGSNGKITHTGMFIGHGKFIQATTHEHPVIQISKLDAYWRNLLVVERRVKP